MNRIRVIRYLAWAIGLAGLAWLVPTLIIDLNTPFPEGNSERLLRTAFGSATPASVGLEVAAAFSLLLIVALAPSPAAVGWLGLAGVTWLVFGLAGWSRLPVELATIADGWGNLVPALVVIGVARLLLQRVPRWLLPVALASGLVEGGREEVGLPACRECHGVDALASLLEAQHRTYLKKQLGEFRSGARANDPSGTMATIARRLSEPEIDALASYLAARPQPDPSGRPAG